MRRCVIAATSATVLAAAFESLGLATLGLAATKTYDATGEAVWIAVAIAGTFVLSAGAKALAEWQFAEGQVRLESSLRAEVTDAILICDWQDFVDQPGHELQSAAISEAPQVAQATITFVRGRASMAAAGIVFASTFLVSTPAAVICAAFGLVIISVFARVSNGLSAVQRRLAAGNIEITRQTSILVSGLRSLRLSPVQHPWRTNLQASFDRHADARRADLTIPIKGRLAVEVLAGIMILSVLVTQATISGRLLPGLIVMALLLRIMPRVQSAQQHLSFARHGTHWIQRWTDRLSTLRVMTPVTADSGSLSQPATTANQVPILELRQVSFVYRRHPRPVLVDVNLAVNEGEWVSLRGVSGGGKSTLIDIIGGILLPSSGSVLLRGTPVHQIPPTERYQSLVIVPQDVQLLGTNLEEILSWNGLLAPAEASKEITAALGVDGMFLFSDDEAGDHIDEMSRDISGGMRTRLAMARALMSHPTVLILDETTSRLHPDAEADIFAAVRKLRPDLSVIVVTHRAETTALVDRQLILDEGGLRTG